MGNGKIQPKLITVDPLLQRRKIGRRIADEVKRRSSLANLVEPAGMILGLLSTPAQTFREVGEIAGSVTHGKFGPAQKQIGEFVGKIFHPHGIGGAVFASGLSVQAASGGIVGLVEAYHGIKNHDKYLGAMGGVDLLSAGGPILMMAHEPLTALGIFVFCALSKAGLVLAKRKEYSRIQKANAVFNLVGAVSFALLQAGLAVVPALAISAIETPIEILYMNSRRFQRRVDKAVDWALARLHPKSGRGGEI